MGGVCCAATQDLQLADHHLAHRPSPDRGPFWAVSPSPLKHRTAALTYDKEVPQVSKLTVSGVLNCRGEREGALRSGKPFRQCWAGRWVGQGGHKGTPGTSAPALRGRWHCRLAKTTAGERALR